MNIGLSVEVDQGHVSLRLSAECADARRELGAVAWAALETLALDGDLDGAGRWVATSNARDLGQRLGIGKDRAAAALAELRLAGLVVAHAGRDARSAWFAPSRYEVRVPVSGSDDKARPSSVAAAPPPTTRVPRTGAKNDPPHLFTDI